MSYISKIIHVHRNSAATCWSNFKTYFSKAGLGYTCDLGDLVSYHSMYLKMLRLWKASYSDRIIDCDYDKLTMHPEVEIKRIIFSLGLSWDKKCLAPHRNKKDVRTASQIQIRRKIYKGSSNDWRHYKPFINDIFSRLGEY